MNAVSEAAPRVRRFESPDWEGLAAALTDRGHAVLPGLLSAGECAALTALYSREEPFRRRVVMSRHNFGRGEYKYFAYPLPTLIADLRASLYSRLAPIANRWHEAMRLDTRFPARHGDYLARCRAAGQLRPTPLLLRYEKDDYNCLHQDLYGDHVFPLQATILLSAPGRDFTGGELVLTAQRPRMQPRAEVVPLEQGDAAVFAARHRPVNGKRGACRVNVRHGVSRLRSGLRFAAGIIFHDAA